MWGHMRLFSHHFSFLNSSWSHASRKLLPENTIVIFELIFHKIAIPGHFPYILCYPISSPYFLLVGLLLQYVALFQSRVLSMC